jgi:hypothetical protein
MLASVTGTDRLMGAVGTVVPMPGVSERCVRLGLIARKRLGVTQPVLPASLLKRARLLYRVPRGNGASSHNRLPEALPRTSAR